MSSRKYAFLMIDYDTPKLIKDIQKEIKEDELYTEEGNDGYGIETDTHVTLVACLDNDVNLDEVPKYVDGDTATYVFSGRRVKRGLYKSSQGLLLNADINGSVNILRKYFKERKLKELCSDSIRAFVNVPCQRLNAFAQAHHFREG